MRKTAMIICITALMSCALGANAQSARDILDGAGIEGGLVVHIGCGNGKLTAELCRGDSFLVHGLDADAEAVDKAREYVRSRGLYGKVSIEQLDSKRLPYTDNLVNLIVAEDLSGVSSEEINRVLAPGGVAYVKEAGAWKKTVKPRSKEIDEWTHFLYDATNNAVSDDSIVGPPRQLQWVAGPKWARSHDHLATISAVVSAAGRIFYIVDEAPTASVLLQSRWSLAARDAFNGVELWKRPMGPWQWQLRGFRSGPSDLARKLVAVADKVYVTLSIDGPLSALDAATGKTIRTYKQTTGTLEVIYSGGTLFVVAANEAGKKKGGDPKHAIPGDTFAEVRSQRPAYLEMPPAKRVLAIDAASGRILWKRSDADTRELMPTTLAVSGDRAFFQNADEILCVDAASGEDIWRAERIVSRSRPTWSAPTLVLYGDVVLSGDRAVTPKKTTDTSDRKVEWIVSSTGGRAPVGELIAFSAKDGKRLWTSKAKECYNAPVDVLVAGGLVWTGEIVTAKEPGVTQGLDPKTGQVVRTRPNDQTFFAAGMGHQRCYRNKATNKYLLFGRSGVEFIDVSTGKAIPHHWTRGACQYGIMPSNGLLYVPSNSCACFITVKLDGFHCLAPKRPSGAAIEQSKRLVRGPAYGKIKDRRANQNPGDWPTYRHDVARTGCTPAPAPSEIKLAWKTQLGGRLSSVVVAQDKLFVARVDAHSVHALQADTGREIWSYTAAGRVDSPPTIWKSRVLFGSADGWVYCLRASDGALAWRFRAAPQEERIVSFGQLESLWPVHGSVLVRDDVVYCAAGRSTYLDGGIRLCRLDVVTGKMLSETPLDDRDPQTGYQRKGVVRGTNMPGVQPDILSADNDSVYMRHARFDLAGRPLTPDVPHLYSAAGFLDDTWWHRTYWQMGTTMGTNYGGWPRTGNQVPSGRLLVVGEESIYGFGRNQYIHHGAHVGIDGATVFHFRQSSDSQRRFTHYRAFAAKRKPPGPAKQPAKSTPNKRRKPAAGAREFRWTRNLPFLVRAMVLADKTLFMAGPPDMFSSDEPAATFEGKKGGLLYLAAAADGKELAQHKLESPPVFDGMAAAGGKLYIATMNGNILCWDAR